MHTENSAERARGFVRKATKTSESFRGVERDVCRQRRSLSLSLLFSNVRDDSQRERERETREGARQKQRDSSAFRKSRNISTRRIANVANPFFAILLPAPCSCFARTKITVDRYQLFNRSLLGLRILPPFARVYLMGIGRVYPLYSDHAILFKSTPRFFAESHEFSSLFDNYYTDIGLNYDYYYYYWKKSVLNPPPSLGNIS